MRGKAAPADLRSDVDGDHPRTCGEKAMYEYGNNTAEGSPPHMRGKGTAPDLTDHLPGDHPRTCGEKVLARLFGPSWGGSPPHMRGKVKSCAAAKTSAWDHPRTCGEKNCGSKLALRTMGSPPHMRGKADHISGHNFGIGITPAHAGKSFPVKLVSRQLQDHPRTCGEKPFTAYLRAWWGGSPPHMRGKASGS